MHIELWAALHWAAQHFHYLFALIPIFGITGNPVVVTRQRFTVKGSRRENKYTVNIPILPQAWSVPFKVIDHVAASAPDSTPVGCSVTSPTPASGLNFCTIGFATSAGAAKTGVVVTVIGK